MAVYSKVLHHSCYEVGHTWNTSCTSSSLELLICSFFDSMRLYGIVYLISTLASRKKLSKQYILQLLKNYFQSVAFLAVNGGGYVASFCVLRFFLRHINFLSASFLPGLLASVVAISIERPARRNALTVYVMNVASECLWNVMVDRGMVKPIKHGGALLFSMCMIFYGYYFKSNQKFSPLVQSVMQVLLGKHEMLQHQHPANQGSSDSLGQTFLQRPLSYKHDLCPHSKSCAKTVVQTCLKMFSQGYLLQAALIVGTSLPKIFRKPSLLWTFSTHKSNFKMGFFLSWFATSYQLMCCLIRRLRNKDEPVNGAIAGAVAGLGLAFNPSNTITLYAFWKAAEALYEKGMDNNYLPNIPYGLETLYSLSTAYLFHIAMMENYNMTPSYWRFLINLTSGRIGDYNRIVLNPFGLNSGKYQKWPEYDYAHLSEAFKKEFHRLLYP